ncbi:hypothetical protein J7L13_01665 [bacterium]|nr:hypothetical protein [bacterium]
MEELDPYNTHEFIENMILAIASKYAENGRIDLDKCTIIADGEEKKLEHEDCSLLRILYQADKDHAIRNMECRVEPDSGDVQGDLIEDDSIG